MENIPSYKYLDSIQVMSSVPESLWSSKERKGFIKKDLIQRIMSQYLNEFLTDVDGMPSSTMLGSISVTEHNSGSHVHVNAHAIVFTRTNVQVSVKVEVK